MVALVVVMAALTFISFLISTRRCISLIPLRIRGLVAWLTSVSRILLGWGEGWWIVALRKRRMRWMTLHSPLVPLPLHIFVSCPTTVTLISKLMGLFLRKLLRLMPINIVKAFRLNELINLCSGNTGENFLHERVRGLLARGPEVRFICPHGCKACSAGNCFVTQAPLVVMRFTVVYVLIMIMSIVVAERLET